MGYIIEARRGLYRWARVDHKAAYRKRRTAMRIARKLANQTGDWHRVCTAPPCKMGRIWYAPPRWAQEVAR